MKSNVMVKTEDQFRVEIPVNIDRRELFKNFRQERTRPMMEKYMDEIISLAVPAARPKGLYKLSCIGARERDWIEIDNVRIKSRVLSKSLINIDTVFPYIFTCGRELDELPVSPKDTFRYFCLDMLKMYISMEAAKFFMNYIKEKHDMPDIIHLHPGEFEDLSIDEQVPLFSLFNNVDREIGVTLTSTKTIQPVKSGSGILFSNGHSFESCQLCLQENCAGRRAQYNPDLANDLMG